MNFDKINDLMENQIIEMYNDIIETTDFFTLSYWYVRCDNGISGRSPNLWPYHSDMRCADGVWAPFAGGATFTVCGNYNGKECSDGE